MSKIQKLCDEGNFLGAVETLIEGIQFGNKKELTLDTLIDYARLDGAEPGNVLDGTPTPTLRTLYTEVYGGEISMDGDRGEDLAKTADKEQLIDDLLFWLEGQV